MVLFSNFSSPEYIMDLGKDAQVTPGQIWTDSWLLCPDSHVGYHVSGCCYFFPWHPRSPCHGISSDEHHPKRNTLQELQWLQQAMTPSSLKVEMSEVKR
uniref:Uncharacterized protein n=1 Tax=Myripristis murdjan TaxID=586833 RepID=A0A667Z4Q0_9TELE